MNKPYSALCACAILAGCATSPHGDRVLLTAPTPLSAVYSEVNMQLKLVITANSSNPCTEPGCGPSDSLDQRVARISPALAKAAYQLYPELSDRVKSFEFIVADKSEPGTASTASGRIAILRPVGALAPTDTALAFILAREIGHVVAKHHEENTATSLIVSGLAQIFVPVANLARVFSNFFLTGTATTGTGAVAAANASVTATSFVGSRVLITSYKLKQREEADAIALNLLARLGYDAPIVAAGFASVDLKSPANDWTSGLQASVGRLATLLPGNRNALAESADSLKIQGPDVAGP